MASRLFTDAAGIEWTVLEVYPGPLTPAMEHLLKDGERRQPWLAFRSPEGERRRISPIPEGWSDCTDFELERWCMKADRVPPAPSRRTKDAG